jgi:tetratricopeptide (TPR) repeat protein
MNKTAEPLYYSQLECPVCKTINEFENIRAGSYTENGKDSDFRPTGRTWLNPEYNRYNPLLFFVATCKKCFYSREFNQDYKNWQKDTSFKTYRLKTIQESHLKELSKSDGIVRILGQHIDQGKHPFESAVIKFLLAIYDLKLQTRPPQLDIGRYFLRIGWLFREKGECGGSIISKGSSFFNRLRAENNDARLSLPKLEENADGLKRMIEHEFPVMFEDVPDLEQHIQSLRQAVNEVSLSINSLITADSKLLKVITDTEKALTGTEPSSESAYFEFNSFEEFLKLIRELWDEVPLSEEEALLKAVQYYEKAYQSSGEISQGIQQVQAAYMIAELSRRVDNYDNANQYFNQAIRLGREITMSKEADKSTASFTKKLLEMAMEQARLNKKESEGVAS